MLQLVFRGVARVLFKKMSITVMNSAMSKNENWYFLDVDPKHVAREREKARKLKKSQWWKTKLNQGLCHYCGKKFSPSELTMDHIVPVARGGTSTAGNVVPACRACNATKKLETPAEQLIKKISNK